MPALALPAFWGAITAGATGGALIYGANKQASTSADAAKLQTDAANHAADVQGKSAADTLAFQKEQAALDADRQDATQHANYTQWASKERRLGSLGELFNFGGRDIPAYEPLPGTHNAGATGPTASGGASSAPPPTVSGDKGDIAGQLDAYFKSRGVANSETPGWVGYWNQWGKNDPAYFNKRLAAADIFGSGAAAPPTSTTPPPGSLGAMATAYQPLPITPALGALGSYM